MKGSHGKKDPADLTPQGKKLNATNTLTRYIRKLGEEMHTVNDEGETLTRFQALAQLVWDRALGFTEEIPETGERVIHKPDKGFIGVIFDRTEGKVAQAAPVGGKKKASLADRIGEQTKARLNRIAKSD